MVTDERRRQLARPPGWWAAGRQAERAEELVGQLSQLHARHPQDRQLDRRLLAYLRVLNASRC
jgi:hypothetical protein